MSLIEEIKNIKSSKKDLRKFGITVGSVLVVLAIVFYFLDRSYFIYFGAAGLVLIIMGFISPVILKPLNKVWMGLAVVLGWLSSRVILIVVFYLVLGLEVVKGPDLGKAGKTGFNGKAHALQSIVSAYKIWSFRPGTD